MGEHVGERNYPEYASTLYRLLKPDGRLLLQQMSRGRNAPGGGAFIESYVAPDMRIITALTVVWGVRLGVHIFVRNSGREEDPRYQDILRRANGNPRLWMYRVYLIQAGLMWIVSLPVQAALHLSIPFGVLDWVGTGVWMVGFAFENYFGDAVVWWGLYLFAAHTWLGYDLAACEGHGEAVAGEGHRVSSA